MSIDKGTVSATFSKEERTYRVECYADEGTDYTIVFHREILTKDAAGKVVHVDRQSMKPVVRNLSKLVAANDPGTAIFPSLRDHGDRWAQMGV